jgi:DNA-binding NarL/FixJ family response regulator
LIAHGHSTQVIADALFLSPHTVQTHRKSIIKKLNIKSPTEFVIYAMDLGLLKPR